LLGSTVLLDWAALLFVSVLAVCVCCLLLTTMDKIVPRD
jgi:hypothetical protein